MTRWINLPELTALQGIIMRRLGWTPSPPRDQVRLDSAVMRPRMAAHYEDADLIRQAALFGLGISPAQAFVDGNKRTGFAAIKIFPESNGQPLTVDPLKVARELERVAEAEDREAAAAAFESWPRQAIASQQ
ncbi:MAG: type II toxin-antitoxin system death-on-curing family toxin [Thermomicrobiales bacterium]